MTKLAYKTPLFPIIIQLGIKYWNFLFLELISILKGIFQSKNNLYTPPPHSKKVDRC